jgi:hypothetical protein
LFVTLRVVMRIFVRFDVLCNVRDRTERKAYMAIVTNAVEATLLGCLKEDLKLVDPRRY